MRHLQQEILKALGNNKLSFETLLVQLQLTDEELREADLRAALLLLVESERLVWAQDGTISAKEPAFA